MITLISPENGTVIDIDEELVFLVTSETYTVLINGTEVEVTETGSDSSGYTLTYTGGFYSGSQFIVRVYTDTESSVFHWRTGTSNSISSIFSDTVVTRRRLAWSRGSSHRVGHESNSLTWLPALNKLFTPYIHDIYSCELLDLTNIGNVLTEINHGWISYSGNDFYIYSDSSIMEYITESAPIEGYDTYQYIQLSLYPKSNVPMFVGIYKRDGNGIGYKLNLAQVHEFTSINGNRTHYCKFSNDITDSCSFGDSNASRYYETPACASISCPFYIPSLNREDVIWDNVDNTLSEFIYDATSNTITLNKDYSETINENIGQVTTLGSNRWRLNNFPISSINFLEAGGGSLSYELDFETGTMVVDVSDGDIEDVVQIEYNLTPTVIYEPQDSSDTRIIDIGQAGSIANSVISLAPSHHRPKYIALTCLGRTIYDSGLTTITNSLVYGPVFSNGDSVILQAKVYTEDWRPCPNTEVTIRNIYSISPDKPTGIIGNSNNNIVKGYTDSEGIFRTIYNSPSDVEALGYYIDSSLIDSGTGLVELPVPLPVSSLEDIDTFTIHNNDPFLGKRDANTIKGEVAWFTKGTIKSANYYMNGRKELLFTIDGEGTISVLTPTFLNESLEVITEGTAYYLLYDYLPDMTTNPFCGMFIATNRFLLFSATCSYNGEVVNSNIVQLVLTAPDFMRGEYALADAEVDAKLLDSHAYYSLDPLSIPPNQTFDPRYLGVKWLVTQNALDYLRLISPIKQTIGLEDGIPKEAIRLLCYLNFIPVDYLRTMITLHCVHTDYLRIMIPLKRRGNEDFQIIASVGPMNSQSVNLSGTYLIPRSSSEEE